VDCRALSIDANCLQAKQHIILHLLCKEGNYTEVDRDESLLKLPFIATLLKSFYYLRCNGGNYVIELVRPSFRSSMCLGPCHGYELLVSSQVCFQSCNFYQHSK